MRVEFPSEAPSVCSGEWVVVVGDPSSDDVASSVVVASSSVFSVSVSSAPVVVEVELEFSEASVVESSPELLVLLAERVLSLLLGCSESGSLVPDAMEDISVEVVAPSFLAMRGIPRARPKHNRSTITRNVGWGIIQKVQVTLSSRVKKI